MFSSRMQPGTRKGHKYHKCSTACESSVMEHLSLRGKRATYIELFQCLATCRGGIWRNQCIFCQIIWRYLQSLVSQGIFNFLHPFIQSLNLFFRPDSTWLEGIQLSLEMFSTRPQKKPNNQHHSFSPHHVCQGSRLVPTKNVCPLKNLVFDLSICTLCCI